ncbi:hypothetical protein DFH28DRAFT_962399 [Melampsora americana]|nr:hypothetical protein DFH28DRAFT_962399 [Melampsora americana]
MILFTHTSLHILFGLLTLVSSKKNVFKSCDLGFARMSTDPTRSYCTGSEGYTYSYRNEDCKFPPGSNNPPKASQCKTSGTKYSNIKDGWCPFYRPARRDKDGKVMEYYCNLVVQAGPTPDKDVTTYSNCISLTNKMTCNGQIRFESYSIEY